MTLVDGGIALPVRYRIVRRIARGGMGSVWLAEDATLGRRVAVKVLARHIADDPVSVTRFAREARAAAKVSDHPNVATIYDVGEHGGVPFIVMEYFAGGSIAGRLQAGGVTRSQAMTWLGQMAAALDYAHAAGIVHRDVKPANLLLDDRDRVAVADFGIARMLEDSSLTQTGQVLGSAGYLSPEQAVGEAATDASDRYALAVVAFELLTGHRPFQADNFAAQALQHVEADRPPSGLGARVDAVLHRGLAKDPERRQLTATLLVDELKHSLEGGAMPATEPTEAVTRARPLQARASSSPVTAPARASSRGRQPGGRRGLAAVAALVALVVAGALVALLAGGGSNPAPERRAGGVTTRTQKQQESPNTQTQTQIQTQTPEPEGAQADTSGGAVNAARAGESPAALNDRGFAMLASNPAAAIPILQASVKGFENQGGTANRITYGYALYNLGQAYLRTGHPADAIVSFERRLQVSPSDRPDVVRRAIAEANRQLGRGAADGESERPAGANNGKNKKVGSKRE